MSKFNNFFSNINVCGDFKEAKAKAKYSGEKYISPCTSATWFESITKIPCRLREFGCFVTHSFKKSWKLRFITFFFIILMIVNAGMIYYEQYNVENNKESVLTNTLYLTTTQITTIGYGDVTPQTHVAKIISSLVHLVVMFITYSMAEEFGYVTVARAKQTEEIENNIKKDLEPISIGITPAVREAIKNNIVKKMSLEGNNNNIVDAVCAARTINHVENNVSKAATAWRDKAARKNATVAVESVEEAKKNDSDVDYLNLNNETINK